MSSGMKGVKKEIKKSVVDHTYRDYSQVGISDLVGDSYKGLNEELFPSKLHNMLSTPECAHIITWKPHGRAWAVVDKSLFISIVLPKYFNHSNFESFNRSVNGWGFKRLFRDGPDQQSYYHELFLRSKLELTSTMTRLIKPGRRLPNIAGEPDFYDISRKYPLPDPPPTPLFKPAEAEEADSNARAHPPLFTPPPTAKRFRQSHSPQGAHSYGQHRHLPMLYTPPPPPYAQHPHYWQRPPHVQHPPYSEPPSYTHHQPYAQPTTNYTPPSCVPYHHTPGHFSHPATTPSRALNVAFIRHPWGPPSVPPHEWHPPTPSPQHDHYHPTAHATIQHHEKHSPGRTLPILHTNQRDHATHLHHAIAENENNIMDGRKPAAQLIISRSEQKQAANAINPLLGESLSQSLEGLERHSSTVKTLYNEEDDSEIVPTPERLSLHAHGQEEHNPLDISNFYDSPTTSYYKKE